MLIKTVKNKGYNWFCQNDIYFKGYFIKNNTLYREEKAIKFLLKYKNKDDFKKLLENIDGQFAIIIKQKDNYLFAVDIARSIPLYYDENLNIISDDSVFIKQKYYLNDDNINTNNLIELFMKGCISKNNTVYSNIKTLDMGQYGYISNNAIEIDYYYRHIQPIKQTARKKAIEDFSDTINKMMNDLIIAINNRPIVLSLSGGYDSRFIACCLKEKGINNVKCYTYGKKNSFEVKESEKVAKSLGYEWINIEYSEEKMITLLNDNNYYDYCNDNNYIIYLQNYLAIKEMKRINYYSNDAVFITGLCADMPSGNYVKNLKESNDYEQELINYLYEYYFPRRKLSKNKEQYFKNSIKQEIRSYDIPCDSRQHYIQLSDCISTGYDHSRKFLNMNRSHEFFGNEWLLPCWNKHFLNFWYSLPMEYRLNQNFYVDYLMNHLFNKYNVDDRKTLVYYSKNEKIKQIKYFLGGIYCYILLHLHKPIKRAVDINNFAILELELFKKIKNKNLIKYKRASFSQLSTIYFIEQRYGIKKVSELKKYIK